MHFHDFYEQMVRYFEAAEDARYLFGGSVILLIGLADVGYRLVRVSRAYRGGLRLPRKELQEGFGATSHSLSEASDKAGMRQEEPSASGQVCHNLSAYLRSTRLPW